MMVCQVYSMQFYGTILHNAIHQLQTHDLSSYFAIWVFEYGPLLTFDMRNGHTTDPLSYLYIFQIMLFIMNKAGLTNSDEGKQQGVQKIIPFLWFDKQAEEAAKFYVSIFKNARIGEVTLYGKEGYDVHGMKEGTVMTVDFENRGAEVCGSQWWSGIQIQRSHFIPGALRNPGGCGLLLGEAF